MGLMRAARLLVTVSCVAALLSSCAAGPAPDAWVLTPYRYDNSLDGTDGVTMIDVTYPMPHVARDGDGGFWTESAGSWLHLDKDGSARRFNLEGDMEFLRVRGIVALNSTQLVVSGHVDGDSGGGLWRFDTELMQWTSIPVAATVVGDVGLVGGDLVYVEYLYSDAGDVSFVVRRVGDAKNDSVITPQISVPSGDAVKLSTGSGGALVVNTGAQVLLIDADRTVVEIADFDPATPVSTTNSQGLSAWATDATTGQSWFVDGGSPEARRATTTDEYCNPRSIETSSGDVSPPLCNIQALEWMDDHTLIVSAGTENATVLAHIRAP
ncbi:hypothetical protein [Microbacterium sp. P02]|uniref:hypothetical protein n=1 Tax=Microbacterium sp. P02 TaxID=3366260 RepID=UPI00366BF2B3